MCCLATAVGAQAQDGAAPERNQYEFETIVVPGAYAGEPKRESFSFAAGLAYLEKGTAAWASDRACVSCHTTGSYLLTRPALTQVAGKPSEEMRAFFVDQLAKTAKEDRAKLRDGYRPTQMAYLAAGLAQWDAHVTGALSPETDASLRLMFELQSEDGSFQNVQCWPPLESSEFHGATVAAMAAAAAPGWLTQVRKEDPALALRHEKLKAYLRDTAPPHDYGRVLLLWAAASTPDLINPDKKQAIIDMVWRHQQSDGGWALRSFGSPETWGHGARKEKLRAEPESKNPPSDGHMTGLAVLVLREAGVPSSDPRIARAVAWIKTNQRESGRWWTRSLNTDKYHFITYSGTCYPLLALARCEATR